MVLVNGSPTKEFRMDREGDPLSLFLFSIVAEGLNIMMEAVKEAGIYKGKKLGASRLE